MWRFIQSWVFVFVHLDAYRITEPFDSVSLRRSDVFFTHLTYTSVDLTFPSGALIAQPKNFHFITVVHSKIYYSLCCSKLTVRVQHTKMHLAQLRIGISPFFCSVILSVWKPSVSSPLCRRIVRWRNFVKRALIWNRLYSMTTKDFPWRIKVAQLKKILAQF